MLIDLCIQCTPAVHITFAYGASDRSLRKECVCSKLKSLWKWSFQGNK